MAEEEFRITGLSPSHAFLLMTVNDNPGIGPKALSEHLLLAPSTVTRFADSLVHKGLIVRKSEGRETSLTLTPEGKKMQKSIMKAWKNLHKRYSKVLGKNKGDEFTQQVDKMSLLLQDSE